MQNKKYKSMLIALAIMMPTLGFAADEAVIDQAQKLIKSGDYQAAYKLLEPLETEHAGEVGYDYLLGVAGVESGNVTRGVFALERVLATEPNNASARTVIAKGHFKLGEVDSAKIEFKNVLEKNQDEQLANAINRYMNAIDKSLGLTTTFSAFLDFGLGHDTNVNSATSDSAIAVPVFGGALFQLNSLSQRHSDNFVNFAGGVSFRHPLTNELSVFSSVSLNNRVNSQDQTFDTSLMEFNGGLKYKKFADTVTLGLQANTFELDTERFRNSHGLSAQWQRDVDDKNQFSLFAQAARLSFKGNSFRNADRYIVGGGYAHVFAGDKTPVLFASAYLGQEDNRDSGADFLGNDIYGVRLGGQLSFTPKLVAYTGFGYENREYDARDPIFLKTRGDDQMDLSVGLRYLPGYNWTIKPQLSYTKNNSNIVLNDFDRAVVSINFRHDFNW
jgi:tetratricopeptide (TPR) repeat protein